MGEKTRCENRWSVDERRENGEILNWNAKKAERIVKGEEGTRMKERRKEKKGEKECKEGREE